MTWTDQWDQMWSSLLDEDDDTVVEEKNKRRWFRGKSKNRVVDDERDEHPADQIHRAMESYFDPVLFKEKPTPEEMGEGGKRKWFKKKKSEPDPTIKASKSKQDQRKTSTTWFHRNPSKPGKEHEKRDGPPSSRKKRG